MSAFASVDIKTINSAGVLAFEASGVMETLKTNMASTSADVANDALKVVKDLAEGVADQWIEPYLVELLPFILDNLAAPKTAVAAEECGNAILHKSNSHSVRIITSALYESFSSMKWQTKKGALVLFGDLAQHHPIVVQRNLPEMINRLILMASDVKKEVKEQTRIAFGKITSTITNVDIIPIIPRVVAAYMDPVMLTDNALDALVGTTFKGPLDIPTLGLLLPVLTRGMGERLLAIKHRSALVIGNMCKLVNDPRTAAEFYLVLKPVLERGIKEIAMEEVRKVCEHSLETLHRVAGEAQVLSDAVFTQADLVNSINESLNENGVADTANYSTNIESENNKTPEKSRCLSDPSGSCEPSASKATTVSSLSKNKQSQPKRMSALASPAPGFNARRGAAYGGVVHQLESSLHRTPGSMFSGASHAPFNPNASLGSATKMPRSTPAGKKAAPAKSTNTVTVTEELSPIHMAVSRSDRPSIGTLVSHYDFMLLNKFDNNVEELEFAMIANQPGAYKHAHQKYQNAEDDYFKCIQIISNKEAKIDSLKTGLGAQIIGILGQLNDTCGDFLKMGKTAEVEARYKVTMEKLKKIDETETENDLGFSCFMGGFGKDVKAISQSEDWNRDISKNLRAGRKMFSRVDKEKESLYFELNKANKNSERALEYMEKWARREKDTNDYAQTMITEIEEWRHENHEAIREAYEEMRKFVPVNIRDLQVPQLMELSRSQGGCLSLELATEIKQNKLLHWIVTHADDIATASFLTGDMKAIFDNFESLDIVETCAIAHQLPAKFESDKDGKKAAWLTRFFARLRQLVAQQEGVLVKGPFCLVKNARVMVAQSGLKPEQQRRAVYFYLTKEKVLIKTKQYTDRYALLARREGEVVAAKAAVQATKGEYDVLLQESRDPAFIKEYGSEMLKEVKKVAKDEWEAAVSTLKVAEQDLTNIRATIESMPQTFDQYKAQQAELVAFLAKQDPPVDWNQRRIIPQPVVCGFDNSALIVKVVKESMKFVSAEEEAAQRKADLEALLSRKKNNAAVVASAVEGNTSVNISVTPGAEDASSAAAGTATVPNTEFKKLSTATLGIFSPTIARSQSEYSLNIIAGAAATAAAGNATPIETPRKRNSVLMNANPDMLNIVNKMLLNSTAATPLNKQRLNNCGNASTTKLAAQDSSADADADENSFVPEVKPVTRSKLLMRKLSVDSSVLGDSSGASPKRSVPVPKLNFLAQLKSRMKATSSEDGDNAAPAVSSVPSAAPAVRGPDGPSGAPRGPMSFRKPEADECTVESTDKATTGAVHSVSGASGGSGSDVKGSEEEVIGEKENSSALDNIDVSKPVSSAFKKASSTSSILGMGMMVGGPGGAMKMSLFDEIRKRRVIE